MRDAAPGLRTLDSAQGVQRAWRGSGASGRFTCPMRCYYCDLIAASDPAYRPDEAVYDLGSSAPRCARHWRFRCGKCGKLKHFMALSWCEQTTQYFCADCALEREEARGDFWAWRYHQRLKSPWSRQWSPTLDRLEFEERHPLQRYGALAMAALSRETVLMRVEQAPPQWRVKEAIDETAVRRAWDANAQRWSELTGDDGDETRRLQTDETVLALLGEVRGMRVLDAGCGTGYLARKLARSGASVTGVDVSERMIDIAREREQREPLGVAYERASIQEATTLAAESFDAAVANFVLMDTPDPEAALREMRRLVKPGGRLVAAMSHPCFACGPGDWQVAAPDSPRIEDRAAFRVDNYFVRGPYRSRSGGMEPVPGFHRPLRDWWKLFRGAGWRVEEVEEPSITERALKELPLSRAALCLRVPTAIVFALVRA